MGETNVRLKLVIDSHTQRVLYGEADKSFIDFLFNLLSLPLGAVIRLLKKEAMNMNMIGCLANLYNSVETFNDAYLQPNQSKESLLKPKVSLLLPNTDTHTPLAPSTRDGDDYTLFGGTYVRFPTRSRTEEKVGFVKGMATYIVMDDLTVKPISEFSIVTLLKELNIKDVDSLEEKAITLGSR